MEQSSIVIEICLGSSCYARGNRGSVETIKEFVEKNRLSGLVELRGKLCSNQCGTGPVIQINDKKYTANEAWEFLEQLAAQNGNQI